MSRPKVLAIVPARGGSKGLPRKNILPLGGKPLLAWSVEHGLAAESVDRVVCTTDDVEIAEIARQSGAEVPFIRPSNLAVDEADDSGFTVHAIEWYRDNENWQADIAVILRPTCPTRTPGDIDGAIQLMVDNPGAHSCLSVVSAPKTPYKMLTPLPNGYVVPLLTTDVPEQLNAARQLLPKVYQQNGFIHAIRADIAVRDQTVIGYKILPYDMGDVPIIDIDTLEDFSRVEEMLAQGDLR
jgi:CMP-N,N'-diacetyllegionaminic acid synthase